MKHLFILITIAFLSFKNKDSSNLNLDFSSTIANSHFESNSENINASSSKVLKSVLYKGTLNGRMNISLYLKEEERACGGWRTTINAMYKYDKQGKWILLDVTTNRQKEKYCMVEDDFTGVLFLEEKEGFFYGNWISPDTKKQFKVVLEEVALDGTTTDELDEILFDDLLYSKNDC